MAPKNEKLEITVTVDDAHSAQEIIPEVEAASLEECQSLDAVNIILGKVALAADTDQVIESIRQVPGVLSADKELNFGIRDVDDYS